MVSSILAVPMVGKVKREHARTYGNTSREDASGKAFAQVLDRAVEEQQTTDAPTECHTVTYGRDSQIQHFLYRTREYHY